VKPATRQAGKHVNFGTPLKTTSTRYPGQCVHGWVVRETGDEVCAKSLGGCGAVCERDEDHRVVYYAADGVSRRDDERARKDKTAKAVSK
jgi:hypothetical protein